MPGMAQHDDHGPHCPAASRVGVGDHAETDEVGLGHLPRGVSSMRTVILPTLRQLSLTTKRLSDG